jgi:hypothetical protein
MLYKLSDTGQGLGTLEPLSFLEVADLQRTEKDLENLLADHLLDVLFEDAALMPIFTVDLPHCEAPSAAASIPAGAAAAAPALSHAAAPLLLLLVLLLCSCSHSCC